MSGSVASLAERRAMLKALGVRPSREFVENALQAIEKIDAQLQEQIDAFYNARPPAGVDFAKWRESQEAQEKELRDAAEREKLGFRSIIQLDELHQSYEDIVKNEERALDGRLGVFAKSASAHIEFDENVILKMNDALENKRDILNLSDRSLVHIPEYFGKITTLVTLDLSDNQLEMLPDAVAGLVNLEVLNLKCNQLKTLPDSIGLLANLRSLNVSSNQLRSLPESICRCSSLVELIANFNQIEYLPSNIGFMLLNLQKLEVHLNKLISLPASICEIKTLLYLDVKFNKLRFLPPAIGNLANLEYLDVSSNFSDLIELPESMGDLVSLKEVDMSFNQIKELPESFGRLSNLTKLKLDQNPLVIPPKEVVDHSFEAVMDFLRQRWQNSLMSEDERSVANSARKKSLGRGDDTAWIPYWPGTGWVGDWFGSICGSFTSVLRGRTNFVGWEERRIDRDSFDQQL